MKQVFPGRGSVSTLWEKAQNGKQHEGRVKTLSQRKARSIPEKRKREKRDEPIRRLKKVFLVA